MSNQISFFSEIHSQPFLDEVQTLHKVPCKETISAKIEFKFIDLFAGIGGFHIACKELGGNCVFACEIDKSARQTYIKNHDINIASFADDITKIDPNSIPDHDLLCAGFPCQPFSQAGFKKGFEDTRGTLFFHIAEIIKQKKPEAFFLENVRHLLNHNNGKTINRIKDIIEELGYSFDYQIVKASDFGLPQHRPRLFMIGFRDKNKHKDFYFPNREELRLTMNDKSWRKGLKNR
jgi:DNA (cytosine-5)-methyltransferase 1